LPFDLIPEAAVQPRIEVRGQGKHLPVAVKPNYIPHAIVHGSTMTALLKMPIDRTLYCGIDISL
jgi:hypothetical protein